MGSNDNRVKPSVGRTAGSDAVGWLCSTCLWGRRTTRTGSSHADGRVQESKQNLTNPPGPGLATSGQISLTKVNRMARPEGEELEGDSAPSDSVVLSRVWM